MKILFVCSLILSVITITLQQRSLPISLPRPTSTPRILPENKFTVISPNAIRRNKDFKIYVHALDIKSSISIKIVLASNKGNFEITKFVQLSKDNRKYAGDFDTSSLPAEATSFSLTVASGSYTKTKPIMFVTKENSIFIQLSKGIFKPAEIVQYRLFSIDSESNAYDQDTPITVKMTDVRNNEIGKNENVTFTNGKFQGEFQLPTKPILGTWKITVNCNGNNMAAPVVKYFVVDEYVLSMFTASLSAPQTVSYASSEIPITINAEYTFKQPVNGIATVTITKNSGGGWSKNISCTDKVTTFYVNFIKDLGLNNKDQNYYLTISMIFIDPKTNSKATDRINVQIVPYVYTLEFINSKFYRTGNLVQYTVVSKTLEGKPAPHIDFTVQINDQITNLTTGVDGTIKNSYQTNTSLSQLLYFIATCSNCLRGYSYINPIGLRPSQGISLKLMTDNPSFNDKINIIATTAERIDSFFYFATAKGVLIDYREIHFNEDGDPDKDLHTVEFSIHPNFNYAPLLRIYAFYYNESESDVFYTNLFIRFKPELPNYLKMNLKGRDESGNKVVKPGENITLLIQSKAYSIVSLAAIDQRVLQLTNRQNFTITDVMNSFDEYNYGRRFIFEDDVYGADYSGLNFFTNIPPRSLPPRLIERASKPRADSRDASSADSSIKVRKDFREVFLFEDVELDINEENADEGSTIISRQVPQQITTYLLYGVSMNKYFGMGLPENLPSTTIFLPFFIDLELPNSVKRNEILTLDIQVFNYLTAGQTVNLAVVKDAGFEVINANKNGWTNSKDSLFQIIKIESNKIAKINLQIKPIKVGSIHLKISAKSPTAGDAIEKVLKVIHEGVERSITTSTLIVVDSNHPVNDQTLSCILPSSAFIDSAEISATVIGDILGKALNNLEKLIKLPCGCGEQTMADFVPDYAIYKYLEATNQLTISLKEKLIKYLTNGFQNELQYQRSDGSFSAFGNRDTSGSTWLTAYVAQYFYLANSIISINSAIIQKALNFIIAHQNSIGSFNEPGHVFDSAMQGASGSGIAMTAYITIVLSTVANDYPNVVAARDKAVKFLEQQLNSVTDTYSLAIIANALNIAKSESATATYNKFYALRTETPTVVYWSVPATAQHTSHEPRSLDIEVTAYGLNLFVARNDNFVAMLKIVKYLIEKSNLFGGYSSTKDTVTALVALSNFAKIFSMNQNTVKLNLIPNHGAKIHVEVNKGNSLTLQTFSLNTETRQMIVNVDSHSSGVAIVSLVCKFYEDPSKTVPSFNINYNFENSCQWRIQMQVCVKPISGNSTNMAIMEIRMPTGYYYYDGWWIHNEIGVISKIETYESNTVVIFYFDNIKSNGNCVMFGAAQTATVTDLKPGIISINDYYDTSKQGTTSFTIPANIKNEPCKPFYWK